MHHIESFLFIISVALLYPVLLGLFFLVLWVVLHAGRFAGECIERRRKSFDPLDGFTGFAGPGFKSTLPGCRHPDLEILGTVRRWEAMKIGRLDKIRFVVRAGPSLGLMGTLIPMGSALASLSQGDMLAMSSNMVTAFTTTIVGIACGTVACVIATVKEHWLRKDLPAIELYAERLSREVAATDAGAAAEATEFDCVERFTVAREEVQA